MRILFLTVYPDAAASPRYRAGQFLSYLQSRGVECAVAAPMEEADWRRFTGPDRHGRPFWYHLHETPKRIAQILSARRHDAVFVQKALMSAYLRGLPSLLKHCSKRIIYDIDDAVHLVPPHPLRGIWRSLEDRGQITKVMGLADVVLAGNAWLAEESRKHNNRVEVFPTVVDTDRFVPPSTAPETFCVGWIGSPSTTPTLSPLRETLVRLPDAQVVLVGAEVPKEDWGGAVIRPWRHETEVNDVQRFSVGLLPQAKDEWTRGKCALKALLYMACGVPCIATPYGAVLDIIQHGQNGLFAERPEEWRDAIGRLRDPAYRRILGQAARATVEERYSLRVAAPRLLDIFRSLQ